jgi:hypothetical protein
MISGGEGGFDGGFCEDVCVEIGIGILNGDPKGEDFCFCGLEVG